MNIFDMIFKNCKSKEVIFSSIYNYLIDPTETHGLGSIVLQRIYENIPGKCLYKNQYSIIEDSVLEVKSEYSLVKKGKNVGKIDSLIKLRKTDGNQVLFIGTEVKILDGSADNTSKSGDAQLKRYSEGLEEEKPGDYILLYLIPSNKSKKSLEHFAAILDTPQSKSFILFWKKSDQNETSDLKGNLLEKLKDNICDKSFEEILQELLQEEQIGVIPPISTEIRYILKSLINVIRNDFNRDMQTGNIGLFPDKEKFLEELSEHKELYEHFVKKYKEEMNKTPIISIRNTSVGFSFENNPPKNWYNTFFRILTMKKYCTSDNEIKQNRAINLIIELKKSIYDQNGFVDTLKLLFPDNLVDISGIVNPVFHPNGKENEEVLLISFKKESGLIVEQKNCIDSFFSEAKEHFKKYRI